MLLKCLFVNARLLCPTCKCAMELVTGGSHLRHPNSGTCPNNGKKYEVPEISLKEIP